MKRKRRTFKDIVGAAHRSPTAPPTQYHKDSRFTTRAISRQGLRREVMELSSPE